MEEAKSWDNFRKMSNILRNEIFLYGTLSNTERLDATVSRVPSFFLERLEYPLSMIPQYIKYIFGVPFLSKEDAS